LDFFLFPVVLTSCACVFPSLFLFKVQANGKLSEAHIDSDTGMEAVPGGPRKSEQELAECEPALERELF